LKDIPDKVWWSLGGGLMGLLFLFISRSASLRGPRDK
jgi:uncharacterized membrane protein YdcZ (DUF606 family)